jgi:cell division septation protein DedD
VAATPNEEGANKLAADLKSGGHAARVERVEVEGKGAMFRVRVTGFGSRDAADAARAKLGQGMVMRVE